MRNSTFEIREHTLECQHIREYARATAESQEAVLHLAIKQYVPLDNPNPKEGDVTIIGTHANGFPKELYEPLWEELYACSKRNGFTIRGIWIADLAHQGASGVLNEGLLGNDPSWMDHPRDLLHMINTFRTSMPLPLVGMGHSLGANMLVNLSLIHPRLFHTVILLDPVIQEHAGSPQGPNVVQASTFRRDIWPSRAEAEASFRKQKFYLSWDPRVLDLWCQYGIRDTPTNLFHEEGKATLTTPKAQEVWSFLRPSWEAFGEDEKTLVHPELVPDLARNSVVKYPFYRPEPPNTFARLGELRPSALYIFGGKSDMSFPLARKQKLERTGVGVGGSGGVTAGRVKEIVLEEIGHLVAMEAGGNEQSAEAAAEWIGEELKRFVGEKKAYIDWMKKSSEEKTTLSEEWKKRIGGPLRPPKGKL